MSKYLNDAYTLRIPAELKAKVAESAKTHNRSMNADIVARLEASFASDTNTVMTVMMENMRKMQIEMMEMQTEMRETRMLYVEAINREHRSRKVDQLE